MVEKEKTERIFFAKWVKVLVFLVFLLSVGIFTFSAGFLISLLEHGMDWEEIFVKSDTSYEMTDNCARDARSIIQILSEMLELGEPFFTDGKLDPEKRVDIMNLNASGEEQNPNTTYTVGSLLDFWQKGRAGNLEDVLSSAYSVYLSETNTDEDISYAHIPMLDSTSGLEEVTDEDKALDARTEKSSGEETTEAGRDDTEVEWEYSETFLYLYEKGKPLETSLPLSGVTLADYGKNHPAEVSLMEMYQALRSVIIQLSDYMGVKEDFTDEGNLLVMVKNLDTQAVYTNHSSWENGYEEADVEDILPVTGLNLHLVRRGGLLEAEDKSSFSDSETYLFDYLTDWYLTGRNEEIVMIMDTHYPVHDRFYRNQRYYNRFTQWAFLVFLSMVISFVTGILTTIVMTVQTGRIAADRSLHTGFGDRAPTEVIFAAICAVLYLMVGIGFLLVNEPNVIFVEVIAAVGGEVILAALFVPFYKGIIRRIKGRRLWQSSLCCAIVGSCKKVYMARMTSGKIILVFLLLAACNIFGVEILGDLGLVFLLILDGLVLLYLIRESVGRQVIRDGLNRIAGGDLDFKIDERELIGDNRAMAETVNRVGDGLQKAIQETIKSERMKADLITNVSHDIKTPLTSIINYVDLLKRENIQDERIQGYIGILDSKSQRLKQLTEDLVEASKVSSGNVQLNIQRIHLSELIWQANGEFEEKFAARSLETVCKVSEEPIVIMADGRYMWRVLENLYNNVSKYAMPHTRVYIELKRIGARVIFEIKNVSENPLNIQAEELTERFIRGDVARSTEGSGLGLSIAQDLVRMQQGTFDIYLDGDLFKVTITFAVFWEAPSLANSVKIQ